MTDRPVIFSSLMVRALIEWRKTQTRRLLKPQPNPGQSATLPWREKPEFQIRNKFGDLLSTEKLNYCRGDRLWVKESIYYGNDSNWYFEADKTGIGVDGCMAVRHFKRNKAPGMYLPRVASRLTLTVTDVRVQRLQDISKDDAAAEGVYRSEPTDEDREWYRGFCEENGGNPDEPMEGVWMAPGARQGWGMTKEMRNRDQWGPTAAFAYRCVWNSLHGKEAWELNPWIAALTFAVEHRNIDAVAAMTRPAPDTLVLTEGER